MKSSKKSVPPMKKHGLPPWLQKGGKVPSPAMPQAEMPQMPKPGGRTAKKRGHHS